MEACELVERELDKVLAKFTQTSESARKILQDLTTYVEDVKLKWGEAPPEGPEFAAAQAAILTAMSHVRENMIRLSGEHRDLHSTVSKVGKAIDRNFIPDFASTSREDVFNGLENVNLLNQAICEHFYRQGMLDIGEDLAKEVELNVAEEQKKQFHELAVILNALQEHNLQPALDWAQMHRDTLMAQRSDLEFMLHRMHFLKLVQEGSGSQSEAIKYARKTFPQFIHIHEEEIQALMGTLLYLNQGIADSPYNRFLDPTLWIEISDIFVRDACSLLGLSTESPLSVCVNAGCTALPALLNVKQMMQQRHVTDIWNGKDELPIDIKLGKDYRYHSIFACPILRQPSSDTNPPMRLVCGHVISRDALNKLCNGNKLKCPYCPGEQNPTDARQIYF